MITRNRRTRLFRHLPSKEKLQRDINLFRGIRAQLAREHQKNPPMPTGKSKSEQ